MTTAQLSTLLDLLPEPARIYDPSGTLVAQNRLAAEAGERQGAWPHSASRDLGDGWRVETRNEPDESPCAEAATDIGTWANGMAHALRNPLSSIVTAAGLVQDDPGVGEETAMLLGVIKKESLHLNRILTDFVHYVRPRVPRPAAFDLAGAVRNTVAVLQAEGILHERIMVEDHLPQALMAWGDDVQICQALWNVVHNAAEAMPRGGTLHLTGRENSGKVVLCVADTGSGFSSEELEHAFDPFYSNKSEGTGLGLSIAQATVSAAGGRIWTENKMMGDPTAGQGGDSDEGRAADKNETASGRTRDGAQVYIELKAAGDAA
jgi:signal transduction histidine kinase